MHTATGEDQILQHSHRVAMHYVDVNVIIHRSIQPNLEKVSEIMQAWRHSPKRLLALDPTGDTQNGYHYRIQLHRHFTTEHIKGNANFSCLRPTRLKCPDLFEPVHCSRSSPFVISHVTMSLYNNKGNANTRVC